MKIQLKNKTVDLSKPIDISLSITSDDQNPIAWYQNQPEISPVTMGEWIGKVSEGKSSTNFNNIFFNWEYYFYVIRITNSESNPKAKPAIQQKLKSYMHRQHNHLPYPLGHRSHHHGCCDNTTSSRQAYTRLVNP